MKKKKEKRKKGHWVLIDDDRTVKDEYKCSIDEVVGNNSDADDV